MNGLTEASKICMDLVKLATEINHDELENLCKASLIITSKNDDSVSSKSEQKSIDKKLLDLIPHLNIISAEQIKNKRLRFGIQETNQNNFITRAFTEKLSSNASKDSQDYEDVTSVDILNAPICDMCIIQRGDQIPHGYYRLSKTPTNKKANLNLHSGGNHIFLCIKKDFSGYATPVTSIVLIFPDKNEFVPPGYFVVKKRNHACNLNTGTSSERIFLCFKKDNIGNPINDIVVIIPGSKGEDMVPRSFSLLETSPTGIPANLNSGSHGSKLYLCYHQQLLRLKCLTNERSPSPINIQRGINNVNTKVLMNTFAVQDNPLCVKDRDITCHSSIGISPTPSSTIRKSSSQPTLSPNRITSLNKNNENDYNQKLVGMIESAATQIDKISAKSAGASAQSDSASNEDASPDYGISNEDLTGEDDNHDELIDEIDKSQFLLEKHFVENKVYIDESIYTSYRTKMMVTSSKGTIAPKDKRSFLLVILTALYIRQGTIAMKTLAAMCGLLKDTDFFSDDLLGVPMHVGSLSMLDVTVEAVCDRFDHCVEKESDNILRFLQILIKHSGGCLSSLSLQRIFRTLSFQIAYYSTRRYWFQNGYSVPYSDTGKELDCFKTLKELIWTLVAQVETVEVALSLPKAVTFSYSSAVPSTPSSVNDVDKLNIPYDYSGQKDSFVLSRSIVTELVEDVIDSVEVSRLSEMAHLAITKQSSTSAYFWKQIVTLSSILFREPHQRGAFVALCSLCKVIRHGNSNIIKSSVEVNISPRDLGSKLLALDALLELCSVAGEKMCNSKIMGYQIRRLVVPCILSNFTLGVFEHRLFSKLLKIITALWKNWRTHIRIEFANIVEQVIIPVLQASTLKIKPILQSIVLQEVVTWFDQPHLIIEMFVNFDMDGKFVSHWKIFSHLVLSMCVIARRSAVVTGAWDWKQTLISQATTISETLSLRNQITVRDVNMQAIEEVARIAKTLMDATGHAFLGVEGPNGGRWNNATGSNSSSSIQRSNNSTTNERHNSSAISGSNFHSNGNSLISNPGVAVTNTSNTVDVADDCTFSVSYRRAIHEEAEEILAQAIKIYQEKGSLKKAVQYLVSKDFMADSPQEISSFLRVYKNSFDASAIGEFLGEGGLTPQEEEYWSMIRFRYTRAVCFVEMELGKALRLYLTGCGFRLPGEAQKIDRFVSVFQKAFWQDNHGTQYCPFQVPDTVHLLAYAIIMLNTDLHRANVDDKKHAKRKKMTKDEFINNLRGCDGGANIDRMYLSAIYDNILSEPIELAVESSETNSLNMSKTAIKDSTEVNSNINLTDEIQFQKDITRTIRDSEDLLRSLSSFTYPFQLASIDTTISMDLVSFMFETVWHHFSAITDSILSTFRYDLNITVPALDILYYSLCSALLLNAKTERRTFATQLKRFQVICRNSNKSSHDLEDEQWFDQIDIQCADTVIDYISTLHKLFIRLKDSVQQSATYELTRNMASKIEKKAKVLENNTFFVYSGELSKRNRSGRLDRYHFFLFSDYLYYCHQGMSGEFKVHEPLELSEMSVDDIDEPTGCSLYINHPTKSFICFAETAHVKHLWIKHINNTIESLHKRQQSAREGGRERKLSMVERVVNQQNHQKKEADKRRGFLSSASATVISFRRKTSNTSLFHYSSSDSNNINRSASSFLKNSSHRQITASLSNSNHNHKFTPYIIEENIETSSSSTMLNLNNNSSYHNEKQLDKHVDVEVLAQQRANQLKASKDNFYIIINDLDDTSLNSLYTAGASFYKGIIDETCMAKMYALQHLIKNGPFSEEKHHNIEHGPKVSTKTASGKPTHEDLYLAWKSLGTELNETDAKKEFLLLLISIAPYWKYQQFL